MKQFAQKVLLATLAMSLVGGAAAHHSRANFLLNEIIEISGTITEKDWVSPHVWFTIEGAGPSGEIEEWVIEGNAIPALAGTTARTRLSAKTSLDCCGSNNLLFDQILVHT